MTTNNLNYVSLLVYMYWMITEVSLVIKLRSKDTDKRDMDKNSMRMIWITLSIAIAAGFYLASTTSFRIGDFKPVRITGLFLIVLGVQLRFMAISRLGKMFTVDVTIRKDHALNTSGMYKYLRHPSYSASLISFLGLGVALNNWLSIPVIFVPVLISFIYRMNVEEKLLQEQFGDEYRNYMKRSHRLLPFVY
ncbi:MAG: isoprenylcysteine carboxylmethyltransferase family protein [Bacteroidetes bacterium]|nr:isoprenylcysteine carboxylmethyltransferase family protein [Bacteroidota bacterium]